MPFETSNPYFASVILFSGIITFWVFIMSWGSGVTIKSSIALLIATFPLTYFLLPLGVEALNNDNYLLAIFYLCIVMTPSSIHMFMLEVYIDRMRHSK